MSFIFSHAVKIEKKKMITNVYFYRLSASSVKNKQKGNAIHMEKMFASFQLKVNQLSNHLLLETSRY